MKPLLRGSAWRATSIFAVIGAAIPPTIYLFWFTKSGPVVEAHLNPLILSLCPIYILSMAFDHMAVRDVREIVALMSLINAVWYFLIGFVVVLICKTFRKMKAA